MTIYLYKKTHNITGLKYLGKTINPNPHKYKGSGTVWMRHIKKHGYDVTTEILKECTSKKELKKWGLYYSELWDVVESSGWANLTSEEGQGFSSGKHHPFRNSDTLNKISGNNNYQSNPSYVCKTTGLSHYSKQPGYKPKIVGEKHHNYDPTLYCFQHTITGEKLHLTKHEFRNRFNLNTGNIAQVLQGTRKTVAKWKYCIT